MLTSHGDENTMTIVRAFKCKPYKKIDGGLFYDIVYCVLSIGRITDE
jgi:hypothetical protein